MKKLLKNSSFEKFEKFEDVDFKHSNSFFKIVTKKYQTKAFLILDLKFDLNYILNNLSFIGLRNEVNLTDLTTKLLIICKFCGYNYILRFPYYIVKENLLCNQNQISKDEK